MSFFDEFTQKAKAVAATAQEKAREAADSAKISAAILSEKRELDRNYRTIGQWYVGENEEAAMEAEEITGTVCPVCGKISSSNFCPNCGAPLEKKEEPAPAEAEEAPKGE